MTLHGAVRAHSHESALLLCVFLLFGGPLFFHEPIFLLIAAFAAVSSAHVSFQSPLDRTKSSLIKNRILLPGRIPPLITAIGCLKRGLDPIGLAEHPLPFVLVITPIGLKEPIRSAAQVSGKAVTSSL